MMGANEKRDATYNGGEYTPSVNDLAGKCINDDNSIRFTPEMFDRAIARIRAEAKAEALQEAEAAAPPKDPTPAPLGAAEITKISSVREAHKIKTRLNAFTREEWLRCTCGWTSSKMKPEGSEWETETLQHIINALAETAE